eukprot:834178-Karenia_brevis.AAC.1
MDQLVRDSWEEVYNGNVENMSQATSRYLQKYTEFLYKALPTQIKDIDVEELRQLVMECGPSAGGMDSWLYDDFKWLPLQ